MTSAITSSTTGRSGVSTSRSLGVNDFIQMMVTQLQNQDPLEPMKNDQLLSQMSQIGQLQSSQELQASLKSLVLQNNIGAAGNLIGKVVQGSDALGQDVLGLVTAVRVRDGVVQLELDSGQLVALEDVNTIVPV